MSFETIGWIAIVALLIFIVGGVTLALWVDYKERNKS